MSRDQQRYRKNYSYYRPLPREGTITFAVDESLDWKNSVRTASTGNHALSGVGTSLSIGGVTVVDEDRVLLKNQGTPSQNGIYYFEVTSGNYVLTRASDARQGTLSSGAATYVEEGTNAGKIYILSTTGTITVDTTSLTWTEFTGGGGSGSPGGSDTYVQFNDGGSFGGVSSLTFNKTTGALTGAYVLATTGFSGSLTKLTDGTPYILAGPNITINTGSNGAVQITGSAGGVTGTGTTDFLPIWTSSNALGNGPIRIWTTNVTRHYGDDHQFSPPSSTDVHVVIKSATATGGRIGIGSIIPAYPLDIQRNVDGKLTVASFRNTASPQVLTDVRSIETLWGAGRFGEGTFRLVHEWNTDRFFTRFKVTNLATLDLPSSTTGPIEDILVFSSDRSVLVTGSLQLQYDASSQVGTVLDVRRSTGNQLMWMSSSAGTNPVGTDVFMWVSGSRSDDNTGANKVVFGGDVRVSGSLTIGTGSITLTSNDIQFGSSAMRIQRSSSDMTFFANSAESFRIKSGGNIGINTNNPSEKLHVNSGNVKVDTTGYGIILPSSPTNVGAQTLDCYLETEMEVSLVCSSEGTMTLDPAYDMLRMTRTGRSVHLQGKLKVDATNATAGGDLWIALSGTGIPDNGTFDSAGSVYLTGFSASLVEPVYAIIEAGGDRIYLRRFYQGSLVSDLANYIAKGSGTAEITISITYST